MLESLMHSVPAWIRDSKVVEDCEDGALTPSVTWRTWRNARTEI
jgi:hypothetical protein